MVSSLQLNLLQFFGLGILHPSRIFSSIENYSPKVSTTEVYVIKQQKQKKTNTVRSETYVTLYIHFFDLEKLHQESNLLSFEKGENLLTSKTCFSSSPQTDPIESTRETSEKGRANPHPPLSPAHAKFAFTDGISVSRGAWHPIYKRTPHYQLALIFHFYPRNQIFQLFFPLLVCLTLSML